MRKNILILLFGLTAFPPAFAEQPDTTATIGGGHRIPSVVEKVFRYFDESNHPPERKRFDVSFIGGPFYSSDTKFGVGLVGSALYRHSAADTLTQPGQVSMKVQLSTTLFYSVGVEGVHIFPGDAGRINYEAEFESFPTYFWGLGYEEARDPSDKSKYLQRKVSVKADYLKRLGRSIFVGPLAELMWVKASDIEEPLSTWAGLPQTVTTAGIGLRASFDTRDVISDPHRGWYVALSQKFFPHFMGNTSHSFSSTSVEVAHYRRLWHGGILAGKLNGHFTYGDTPWTMMATFGGSSTMRGYYAGQYRDKNAADITFELRQHVWKRSGVAVWVGAATVFPKFSELRWRKVLPNAGVGYRFEFKKRVNVRVDVGVGRGTWGVEFNINEAF